MNLDQKLSTTNKTRTLTLLITLSVTGGLASVLVGYTGRAIASLEVLPLVIPQLLSGFHVIWLTIAYILTKTHGSATFAGALKGFIETLLTSHLGPLSLILSTVEGLAIDAVFILIKKPNSFTIYLSGGVSAASSLAIIQLLFWQSIPQPIILAAYAVAFSSGFLLNGYLSTKVIGALPNKT